MGLPPLPGLTGLRLVLVLHLRHRDTLPAAATWLLLATRPLQHARVTTRVQRVPWAQLSPVPGPDIADQRPRGLGSHQLVDQRRGGGSFQTIFHCILNLFQNCFADSNFNFVAQR